jgi:hypothetical protein
VKRLDENFRIHQQFKINKTPAQGVRSVGKGEGQQQNCLECVM